MDRARRLARWSTAGYDAVAPRPGRVSGRSEQPHDHPGVDLRLRRADPGHRTAGVPLLGGGLRGPRLRARLRRLGGLHRHGRHRLQPLRRSGGQARPAARPGRDPGDAAGALGRADPGGGRVARRGRLHRRRAGDGAAAGRRLQFDARVGRRPPDAARADRRLRVREVSRRCRAHQARPGALPGGAGGARAAAGGGDRLRGLAERRPGGQARRPLLRGDPERADRPAAARPRRPPPRLARRPAAGDAAGRGRARTAAGTMARDVRPALPATGTAG